VLLKKSDNLTKKNHGSKKESKKNDNKARIKKDKIIYLIIKHDHGSKEKSKKGSKENNKESSKKDCKEKDCKKEIVRIKNPN
jgi:hypothetical protein